MQHGDSWKERRKKKTTGNGGSLTGVCATDVNLPTERFLNSTSQGLQRKAKVRCTFSAGTRNYILFATNISELYKYLIFFLN